jgi:hypothetical protein
MNRNIRAAALCLGLLTFAGGSGLLAAEKTAKVAADPEQELKAKMTAVGFKEITRGVFERQRGRDKTEHLGYGREGLVWMVGELTRQHDALLKEYQSYPSEDLHKVIDGLSLKIADARRELRSSKSLSAVSAAVIGSGCSLCYSATSDAYPLSGTSGQGVGAVADASFSSSCGFSGDTDAYAYARATLAGTTTTHIVDDPHTGTSVTSHAAATLNGTSNCLSMTSASAVSTALGISYSTSDTNSTCPMPAATISGPATASIAGTSCQTLTWTATTNGGASPFSYAWTIDGASAGTSSSTSVSQTYCGNNTTHSQTANVALTVTDSTSQTASSSFATAISYTAITAPTVSISGPAYVSGTSCTNVTWNLSYSGGSPAYSFAWTVDGVATGSSTSTSITKQYCSGTDRDVSVGLTVTDTAGHTGSATFTTTVYITCLHCQLY